MIESLRVRPAGATLRRLLLFSLLAAAAGILAGTVASVEPSTSASALEQTLDAGLERPDAPIGDDERADAAPLTGHPAPEADTLGIPPLAPAFEGAGTVIFFLGLVLAAALLLVKRGARKRPVSGQVRVVDTVPLGGRRLIHLIRCGDRRYLIGNSERGIHFLASVDSLTEEEGGRAESAEDTPEGQPTFEHVFGSIGAAT